VAEEAGEAFDEDEGFGEGGGVGKGFTGA